MLTYSGSYRVLDSISYIEEISKLNKHSNWITIVINNLTWLWQMLFLFSESWFSNSWFDNNLWQGTSCRFYDALYESWWVKIKLLSNNLFQSLLNSVKTSIIETEFMSSFRFMFKSYFNWNTDLHMSFSFLYTITNSLISWET